MDQLGQVVFPYIVAIAITIPRIVAAFLLIPVFSFKTIRGLPRYAVAVAVGLPISVTLVEPIQQANFPLVILGLIAVKEALIGFIIGFLLTLPFWMFQSIGVMIDNQRGALSGGYFNPGAGPDSSMLADALSKALVIVLIITGAFPAMFAVLVESYLLWPTLQWMPSLADSGYTYLIDSVGAMLYGWVMYSGPIILILLLVEAGFAILGVYIPQLQVYFMAMPIKSIVALIILIMYSTTLWDLGGQELIKYYDTLLELPKIFIPF